jgi:hypothetical protein
LPVGLTSSWIGCHADRPELAELFGDDIAVQARPTRSTGAARHSLYCCSGIPVPIERLTVEFPGDPEHLIFNGPKMRRCGETVSVDQRIGPNARVRPDYLRGFRFHALRHPDCAFRA